MDDKLENKGMSINLTDTEPIFCENCGGELFDQALLLRKVSSFLTGTGQSGLVPVSVFECTKCHHVLKEFLPDELKAEFQDEKKNDISSNSEQKCFDDPSNTIK